MAILKLEELSLRDKRVIMRVDYNVPFHSNGIISDDSRIQASIPSIQYILNAGGSVVLMSHLGRPKSGVDSSFSLAPCAKRLSELLGLPVPLAPDCVGPIVEQMASDLKAGEVLLLENLRFHKGEENPEKEPNFVSQLAKLGQAYVNDAFGTAHRAHASTALIAKFFPQASAAGLLMQKEIQALDFLIHNPPHPFYAIIGGSKVSTKIGLIKHLLDFVDVLFVGGAMTFTFMKAQGKSTGASLVEIDQLELAKSTLNQAKKAQLRFPVDLVIADSFSNAAKTKIISMDEPIPDGWQGLDIGPDTVKAWSKCLEDGAVIFWNGPVGAFEMSNFACGTKNLAVNLSSSKGKVVVGGGDSIAAIQQSGLASQFYHLSTGGGASLEFLENGHLPGIDALTQKA